MTQALRRDHIDPGPIHYRLGKGWTKGEPLGDDTWYFFGPGGQKIIVSYDPDSEPGMQWVHASMSYEGDYRLPSYSDLKQMHHAVFFRGHAYQCFVPDGQHINIKSNVLHLWGRLDGRPALPDFGRHGTI